MLKERRRQAAQRGEAGHQPGIGDRADHDVHQGPAAPRLVPQPRLAGPPRTGVQGQPPPRFRGAGHGREDLRLQPLARKGLDDLLGLPLEIPGRRPVLQGAAAAVVEMRARRRLPLSAGRQHLRQLGPAGPHLGLDPLARQGEGDIDRALGDAVALAADAQHLELAQLGPGQGRPLILSARSLHLLSRHACAT